MPEFKPTAETKKIMDRFTDAQLEYLRKACESAALLRFWDGSADHPDQPCLRRKGGFFYAGEPRHAANAPEQSIVSLTRRGGARLVEKEQGEGAWKTVRYWVLTQDGIKAGLAEFERHFGKDLLKEAAKRKAQQDRDLAKEKELVQRLAKPFRGINIRIGEGKERRSRDLGAYIEKTILGKGTAETVNFDRSMIEQLGKALERLRGHKR